MGLFSKKTKAADIAEAFFQVVLAETDERMSSIETASRGSAVDSRRMVQEVLYLRAATVDFATTWALGQSPEKASVLDAFYDRFRAWSTQQDSTGAIFEMLRQRVWTYAASIKSTKRDNPLEDVGKTLARLCESEDSLDVRLLGSVEFAGICAAVNGILEDRRIVL